MKDSEAQTTILAPFNGAVGSSYMARLQMRQSKDSLRQSTAGKSITDRLLQKSIALQSNSVDDGIKAIKEQISAASPQFPRPTKSLNTDSILDDAAAKLEKELATCDQQLQLIKSHAESLHKIQRPPLSNVSAASTKKSSKKAEQHSIVRAVITATGQGCKDIIASSTAHPPPKGSLWKTRPSKASLRTTSGAVESSCMLQLTSRYNKDVVLRITFAEAATVPAYLCFEHASSPTSHFNLLGRVPLQEKSMKQLKHVFRLGPVTVVKKCLRITSIGHIIHKKNKDASLAGGPSSGIHSVSYLLITGEVASQDELQNESKKETMASSPMLVDRSQQHQDKTKNKHRMSKLDGGTSGATMKKKAAPPAPPPPPPSTSAAAKKKGAPPPLPPPLPPSRRPAHQLMTDNNKNRIKDAGSVALPAPSKPTLKLFWDKVQPRASAVQATVWGQLSPGTPQVDFAGLEDEFAAKAPALDFKAKTIGKKAPLAPRLLTLQRTNNVGALLARLKLSPEQARDALLKLLGDDGSNDTDACQDEGYTLHEDDVESLLQCLPTEDEARLLAKYNGPTTGLTPAETFMLLTHPIPALRARLEAIIFLRGFDARVVSLADSARCITQACSEVKESKLLRSILKTALAIGNFLNTGNRNGNAAAFQVDALLKLQDIRSTKERSTTLLHFLAREVARQHPGAASLTQDLPHCTAAARLSLVDLRSELEALADGIEAADAAGREAGADPQHLEDLITVAIDRLATVNASVVEADASFLELRSYFSGKPSTMDEPSAFFTLMSSFCKQLEKAHADNGAVDAVGREGRRPASAPAQKTNVDSEALRAATPEATAAEGPRTRVTPLDEETPPLQRRDRMLTDIRLYSKMSIDERRAMLTEKGAQDRIKKMAIAHRHSIAVVPSYGSGIAQGIDDVDAAGDGAIKRVPAVRASAPVASLGALSASSRDAKAPSLLPVKEENGNNDDDDDDDDTTVQLSDTAMNPDAAQIKDVFAIDSDAPDDTTTDDLSSPVARLVAASRHLIESVCMDKGDAPCVPPQSSGDLSPGMDDADEDRVVLSSPVSLPAESPVRAESSDASLDFSRRNCTAMSSAMNMESSLVQQGTPTILSRTRPSHQQHEESKGEVEIGEEQKEKSVLTEARSEQKEEEEEEQSLTPPPPQSTILDTDTDEGADNSAQIPQEIPHDHRSSLDMAADQHKTPSMHLDGVPSWRQSYQAQQPVWCSVATSLDLQESPPPSHRPPHPPPLPPAAAAAAVPIDVPITAPGGLDDDRVLQGDASVDGMPSWVQKTDDEALGHSKRVSFSAPFSPPCADPGDEEDEGQGHDNAVYQDKEEGTAPRLHLDSRDEDAKLQEDNNGDDNDSSAISSMQEKAAALLGQALVAHMRQSLPRLPGISPGALPALPLPLSPANIDVFMAAVIANAGNTPTGPLARGVRQGDHHLFDDEGAQALRQAAAARGQRKALLEPVVPAPLGMGVRASETVAHGISPTILRHSLEAHLRMQQEHANTAAVSSGGGARMVEIREAEDEEIFDEEEDEEEEGQGNDMAHDADSIGQSMPMIVEAAMERPDDAVSSSEHLMVSAVSQEETPFDEDCGECANRTYEEEDYHEGVVEQQQLPQGSHSLRGSSVGQYDQRRSAASVSLLSQEDIERIRQSERRRVAREMQTSMAMERVSLWNSLNSQHTA